MNLIRKGFDKLLSFGCIILETIGIKCMGGFFFFFFLSKIIRL